MSLRKLSSADNVALAGVSRYIQYWGSPYPSTSIRKYLSSSLVPASPFFTVFISLAQDLLQPLYAVF